MDAEGFAAAIPVSRETLDRLKAYADLLIKWQKAVNLVGPKTLADLWRRHMLDSAQLLTHVPADPPAPILVDLGSGGGFPGVVLATLLAETRPGAQIHLIESDLKKATFLREAARITDAPILVHAKRIEAVSPFPADVVTARALAPLSDLLTWSQPFWRAGTTGLFLKGQDIDQELTAVANFDNIYFRRHPSASDARGVIIEVRRRS